MSNLAKIGIVAALVAAIAIAFAAKRTRNVSPASAAIPEMESQMGQTSGKQLPRFLELGSDECVPCKLMAPILAELRKEYSGTLQVDFIDVNKSPEEGSKYGITLRPTQILFDASGKELFRHEGFIAKADILAKWKELGVDLAASPVAASQLPDEPASEADDQAMSGAYPDLASGVLTHAHLAVLPEGTLLKSGEVTITEKDAEAVGANAPDNIRAQLSRNAFFVLERVATPKILLSLAREDAVQAGRDVSKLSDQQLIEGFLERATGLIQISDKETSDFYDQNKAMFSGAPFEAVKKDLAQYLSDQKRQEAIKAFIESIGQKRTIEVSAAWVKSNSAAARDNPVDKARLSGRPSLVDFGSKGCVPCDMLAPILETLRKKHEGKANVVFVQVTEQEILAMRYGIDTIPVQVFFDKDGKEVFRHTGFFPQEEIEKKLAEMGVQ